MDKQERDRLREYANNHLNGRESDFTFFTPVEVLALLDHIDALEGQVARLHQFQRWAESGLCPALLNDDDGHWVVSFDGVQNVPADDEPNDIATSFFIDASEWKDTVEDAIDAAEAALTQAEEKE